MRRVFVKQQDATDCAAACLAMICLHYKKETTITKLRDIMGTDIKGTNLIGLSKCANQLGFVSQAIRVDKEGFLSEFSLPCIANIHTKDGLSHFVVIYKITPRHVVIGDPAKEFEKQSMDDFWDRFTGVLLVLKPSSDFEIAKDKNDKMFSRFLRLLLPQKKLFVYSILSSILLTLLGIVSSLFNKILMDEVLPYRLKDTLLMVLIIFALIAIVQVVIGFVRQWIMIYLSQKIDIPLMLGYFKHIYQLPMKFFASRKTGDIITRFSDAFTIKDIFTSIALTLIMDIVMALATGVILLKMNTELFGIILFMVIISVLLVFIFKQPYKQINEEQMQQGSILNSQIIESLQAVETIKGNANEEFELEQLEKEYIKSLRIGLKEGMLSNVQGSISGMVSTIGNLVMMYFGITQVINNEMTLGTLMAFTTLSGYFMDPIGRLVSLQLQIQEANISMKRMAEILDYPSEQSVSEGLDMNDPANKLMEGTNTQLENLFKKADNIGGEIEFDNVTFRYGNRKPVLKNLNLKILPGEKVALVGYSGSGKSTIAKLLLKYYEPELGSIRINGVDIHEYDNKSLRKAISYVPQNVELFSKTIFDNIRVSRKNATLEDVKKAAKMAGAHEFISRMPMQYYSFLEEAGNGLSGGEKQRIVLARAFLKKNNFFILDESTSNLDFGTEKIIFDMIYNTFSNKTMLIIAHRLATIKNCDKIVVLDEGEVIECGTHEELLNVNGKYKELWDMQQGNIIAKSNKKQTVEETVIIQEIDEICYV